LTIRTVNPYTMQTINEFREDRIEEISAKINGLNSAQQGWKRSLDRRLEALKEIARRLRDRSSDLATLMTLEMGKPITQSEAEVKKCAWLVDYLQENASRMLEPEVVETEAKSSYVRFDPVGTILIIMPWNFPLWQAMRAAIPALAAGNAVLLKHASIVSGTSLEIEKTIDLDVFKSTIAKGNVALEAINYVDGVSFTGSTEVGSRIAEVAGAQIKKSVLELGGSDPFIVLDDTNLEQAIKNCAFARMQNNGQSCIASKRFIVHESVYDSFVEGMREEFGKVSIGNPLVKETFLGPLSSKEQKETVMKQIDDLKKVGDVEHLGGTLDGNFVPPTIARTDALYGDEIFGPVAIVNRFKTPDEAVQLANETPFGLGASIWGDPAKAEELATDIKAGMVFVNRIVSSDPRLPFGGMKKSGVGVELSRYGLLEFTAKKTIWIN
jgi:succinate-semialdehyde dehydrogenase/glutarate-semialdehyde dehydrogenase